MAYSTITKKKCKCGDPYCDKWPTLGYKGYFINHVPEELKQELKKGKVDKSNRAKLNTISRNLKGVQEQVSGQNKALALAVWFRERRTEMTGYCVCGCGQKSCKDDNRYFKHSIAHVLGKAKFPSVDTHSQNFIELAFWGGCHGTLDDMGYAHCKETKPILWAIIVRKFKILFPCIAEEEIKFIPDVLLETLQD